MRKHDPAGAGTGNIGNGTAGAKTVLTEESAQVETDVPRDGQAPLNPQIVKSASGDCSVSIRSCCRCMPISPCLRCWDGDSPL
jgi:hypothetical protein